jgi:hypothetical protein
VVLHAPGESRHVLVVTHGAGAPAHTPARHVSGPLHGVPSFAEAAVRAEGKAAQAGGGVARAAREVALGVGRGAGDGDAKASATPGEASLRVHRRPSLQAVPDGRRTPLHRPVVALQAKGPPPMGGSVHWSLGGTGVQFLSTEGTQMRAAKAPFLSGARNRTACWVSGHQMGPWAMANVWTLSRLKAGSSGKMARKSMTDRDAGVAPPVRSEVCTQLLRLPHLLGLMQ